MSDYYIKMSELIELAKDRVVLDPELNRGNRGNESFVKGAKWGVETLTILADANLQHYDFDNLIMNLRKCPYCGDNMIPRVTKIMNNNRVMIALSCVKCNSITPEILFTSSYIDQEKLTKEIEFRVKSWKSEKEET